MSNSNRKQYSGKKYHYIYYLDKFIIIRWYGFYCHLIYRQALRSTAKIGCNAILRHLKRKSLLFKCRPDQIKILTYKFRLKNNQGAIIIGTLQYTIQLTMMHNSKIAIGNSFCPNKDLINLDWHIRIQ